MKEGYMAGQSAFDKRHVEANALSEVEGLLEHFNLPPAAISYIRKNKTMLQIALAIVVGTVVAWALYGSYHEKKIENSTSALSVAMQAGPAEKAAALEKVASEFSGTSAAVWAKVELAHLDMENKKFSDAVAKYSTIKNDLDASDPLYALAIFGIAQANEANHDYKQAAEHFALLKDIGGYQAIGHLGLARIQETEGEIGKAIETLSGYLGTLTEISADDANKRIIEEKISRLKALK